MNEEREDGGDEGEGREENIQSMKGIMGRKKNANKTSREKTGKTKCEESKMKNGSKNTRVG